MKNPSSTECDPNLFNVDSSLDLSSNGEWEGKGPPQTPKPPHKCQQSEQEVGQGEYQQTNISH